MAVQKIVRYISHVPMLMATGVAGVALTVLALPVTIPLGVFMSATKFSEIEKKVRKNADSPDGEDSIGLPVIFASAAASSYVFLVPLSPAFAALSIWGRSIERLRED